MSTTEHDTDGTLGETGGVVDPVDLGMPAPGGAFDEHHPPDAALIGDCVHCGFCLPTCPTYVLWGEEMDSPRGRIYLMKEGLEGEPMTDSMVRHFDACLGCMACVTACPSGVQYDRLIEADPGPGRAPPRARRAGDRRCAALIFALFPHPRRLRLLRGPLRAYQAHRPRPRRCGAPACSTGISPAAGRDGGLAPRARPARAAAASASRRRARGGRPSGCSPAACRARSSPASTPPPRGCCAPRAATSSSRRRRAAAARCRCTTAARRRRRRFARALDRRLRASRRRARRGQRRRLRLVDEGVRRAAGRRPGVRRAGAGVRRRRSATSREILDELGPVAPRHPLPDDRRLPRRLPPRARPGRPRRSRASCSRRSPAWSCGRSPRRELCCGSAGIYNLLNPEPARELGDRKAANIVATGAELLVTANPGCLMQVTSAIERLAAHRDGHGPHRRGARRLDPRGSGRRTLHRPPDPSAPPLSSDRVRRCSSRTSNRSATRWPSSALCAAIPLLTLFVLLGGLRMNAWVAGLISLGGRARRRDRALRHAGRAGAARRPPRARRSASSRSCGSSSTRSGSTT